MAYNQLVVIVLLTVFGQLRCLTKNRPPQFLPGGDMARFSISEDTPVGKSVYKLSAIDPDGSSVSYTISGQHLSVDRSSGVVTLVKPLDRETLDSLEVVISATDQPIKDSDTNTVSLRREITVIDVNDNPPEFLGRPYSFSVLENTQVGTIIYNNITVVDKDIGLNSEISMTCTQNNEPCRTFNLLTEKVSAGGTYVGSIRLARPLDFDTVSSYKLTVRAMDGGTKTALSSMANVSVVVRDVQDERPVFTNSPYSIVIDENTPAGVQVLKVTAEDGDAGLKRPVVLSIEDDSVGYFAVENESNGTAYVYTSETPIDRENKVVSDAGGIYTFRLKATELINNELPGDVSYEIVTVVVQDVDDEKPEFNEKSFTTSVSEDISIGTPLPGLNIIVNDKDLGNNGRYVLVMRNQDPRVVDWFRIIPEAALGRTNVLIRLVDNDRFDYDAGVTSVDFDIVAMYQDNISGGFKEASAAHVNVNVLDANDNLPKFDRTTYAFSVPENLSPGTNIANLTATDIDSGINSKITYSLQGFGMDKFGSDPEFGGIYLTSKVDYEQQSSYSLTLEAKDGGNRSTHVVILVEIIDVNDNAPVFNSLEYKRTIREGLTEFQPKFFVQASDADSGLNAMVRYSVLSSNHDGVVQVNPITGELTLNAAASSSHTSRGQYEVVIRATDQGVPPLHADVDVSVRVGASGNQRPVFKNLTYSATVPETARRATEVLRVRATDPDGPDDLIEYSAVNGHDNFRVDRKTGAVTVSERAVLDLDAADGGASAYHLVVAATDGGLPIREVAHTDVYINVTDVNDKPPKFVRDGATGYIAYLSETTDVGRVVFRVNAVDPDKNAAVEYAIVEPIRANDKTGLPLKSTGPYNFKEVFSINKTTGEIKLNTTLNHRMASMIVLTVRAVDANAAENVNEQYDQAEVTFFVKPHANMNPVFINGGGGTDGALIVRVDEETPIGAELVQLRAVDALTNESLYGFEPITAVPRQVAVDYVGRVILTERLDYETLEDKMLTFQVKVTTQDGERSSLKTVVIEVQDINDNSPEFEYPIYRTSLVESSPRGTIVLLARANDKDSPTSQHGMIRYYLEGENSQLFTVDPTNGEISVSGNGVIDREKNPSLKLMLFASDTPQGGPNQKISSVPVQIDVKDLNDNAPEFDSSFYIAVVLENVVPETSVLNVSAHDPDEGSAGLVNYKLIDDQLQGYLYINPNNGQIRTTKRLTGKGRSDPYEMKIRAEDNGEPEMFTDVKLSLYISNIIENDGVPTFVHPTVDELAYVSENASIGSLVFRALATDPDDPSTMEGTIHYSFLEETQDTAFFSINSETGLITTKAILDRETQDKYTLVLVAKDLGDVPQQSTKVFNVIVTDVDDNRPVFNRSIEEKPLMMEVEEESPYGTFVGYLSAYDPDIGDNALIDYVITDGNDGNVFYLNSTDNKSELRVNGEIDRESVSEYVLTIKCFKHKTKMYSLHKTYNKQDPSERQVIVKVIDVDDNLPKFVEDNITLGVRVSVPLDTLVATIQATDVDSSAEQITYHITNLVFFHYSDSPKEIKLWPFFLDQLTGQMRTTSSMAPYAEGHFDVAVVAVNSDILGRHTNSTIKVFIVKDRGLLKFVFTRPPNVVGHYIKKFKKDVEKSLGISHASLNLYDTQFYSKDDGSLDFSSTGSCFQLVGPNNYNPKDTILLLEDPSNHELKNVYKQYEVKNIERCYPKQVKPAVTWVQMSVLGIAIFIGIVSIFSITVLCCSYKKWKKLR